MKSADAGGFENHTMPRVLFSEAGHWGGSVGRLGAFLASRQGQQLSPSVLTWYKSGAAASLHTLSGVPSADLGVDRDPAPEPLRRLGPAIVPTRFALRQVIGFWRALRRWHPNAVHFNNTPFCHLPALAVCRVLGVPFTVHLRDTVHLTRAERFSLASAKVAIALSETARVHYQGQGIRRIQVVYNGIDIERFDRAAQGQADLPPGRWTIALAGALVARKCQSVAIEAVEAVAREFPEVSLVLLGEGPGRAPLEAEVQAKRLDQNVIFAGFRSPVAPYLRRSQVGLMISDREGMANVVLEYMAAALPVVVTDLPGVREMVTHGETGFVVPVNSARDVVLALRRLLADPEGARKMGQAGRAVLDRGRFSMADEHQAWIRLLQEAVGAPTPGVFS